MPVALPLWLLNNLLILKDNILSCHFSLSYAGAWKFWTPQNYISALLPSLGYLTCLPGQYLLDFYHVIPSLVQHLTPFYSILSFSHHILSSSCALLSEPIAPIRSLFLYLYRLALADLQWIGRAIISERHTSGSHLQIILPSWRVIRVE